MGRAASSGAMAFSGRLYDENFLSDLPPTIDPCGENGEFHSFVFDGPTFAKPLAIKVGERVTRNGRFYADLLCRRFVPTFYADVAARELAARSRRGGGGVVHEREVDVCARGMQHAATVQGVEGLRLGQGRAI